MSFLRYALVTVPALLLAGTLSRQLSGAGPGNPWFEALVKPNFMLPGWAVGLGWTILYILFGLVLAMLLHARGARGRPRALGLFALQLGLVLAWPLVFFALHDLGAALSMMAAMVVLAMALVAIAGRIRPVAAALLIPCLAWLIFAALFNFEIKRLNPDAQELVPRGASTDIQL